MVSQAIPLILPLAPPTEDKHPQEEAQGESYNCWINHVCLKVVVEMMRPTRIRQLLRAAQQRAAACLVWLRPAICLHPRQGLLRSDYKWAGPRTLGPTLTSRHDIAHFK